MECDDGNAISWDGCTEGAVTEFLVSSEFQVVRSRPAVGVSYAGNILVAWAAHEQVLPGWEVFARVIGVDGQFVGPEFQVNTTTQGEQSHCVVTPLKAGGFAVLWPSRPTEDQPINIFGRRLAEDGEKLGGEFQLTASEVANQMPRACDPLPDGGFVVVWKTYPNGDTSDGNNRVMARILDDACLPVTDDIVIATHFAIGKPAVATYSDGSFAVVWDAKDDGLDWDIFARKFGPSGEPGVGPAKLTSSNSHGRSPHIATDAESLQSWVLWRAGSPAAVVGTLLDSNLVPTQGALKLSGSDEAAPTGTRRLADGRLAVAWNDLPSTGGDVHMGVRTWTGEVVVEEVTVNALTADTQESGALGLTADGGLIVVWRGQLPGGGANSFGIYAQRFDSDGNRLYH